MSAAIFFKDRSLRSQKTELCINYLIVALGFTLPISVAANNIILALILILWLIGGDFKKKWERIKSNKAAIAIILFFLLHFVGLLYSSDPKTGLFDVIKREVILLFMPIILSVVKKEFIKKGLTAFLAAMFISEVISYGLYFEIIESLPWREHASSLDINPFMSHISYTPLLAFAVILLLNHLIFEKNSFSVKIWYMLFILTMSFNIFISGGRAGQVGFIVILLFFIVYTFKNELKKMLLFVLATAFAVIALFFVNNTFHSRVMQAYHNIDNFHINPNTSVGLRINWAINSIELIKESPIIGFGTGAFKKEYERINSKLSPKVWTTAQPHNFYLFTLVQFGAIGLVFLLAIFFILAKIAFKINDKYRGVRYAFILLFLTIMLSDSYLLGHYTTLFFAYIAALLFGGRVEID